MNRSLLLAYVLLASVTNGSYGQTSAPTQPAVQEKQADHPGNISAVKRPNLELSKDHTESWTEISLTKSHLNPSLFNAVLLSKIEEPTFTREIVRMEWREGDPIEVYILIPHGVTKPPVLLYLYDYTSDTDRFRNPGWGQRATQNGFAAVGFVSAVSGQRFHVPRPMKEWFVGDLQEALATTTHDVQMLVNYLAVREDLDAKTVGMFGQGSGGTIALLAAAADPRITAVDALNPWGDWPDWLKDSKEIHDSERPTYLAPAFLANVATLDPVTYLPSMKDRNIRIELISDDTQTPPSARRKIAAAIPKPEDLMQYPDSNAHAKVWKISGLTGWLREQIRPTSVAVNSSSH